MTLNQNKNPFLNAFSTIDFAVPFDKIKLEHYLPALEEALKEARSHLNKVIDNPAPPNFENSVECIEFLDEKLQVIISVYSNLELAHADDQHRALADKIYPQVTAWSSDVLLNEKLFHRIKQVYEDRQKLSLTLEQQQLLDKTYKSFVRNGALLSTDDKKKLRDIDQQMSVLGPQFSENVLKCTNEFELWIDNRSDLEGLPQSIIDSAAAAAVEKKQEGKWLFTLHAPSYIPFLTYSKRRHLKEKIWRAFSRRAYKGDFDNSTLIKKILSLRHQRAQLLGFKNHAAFILEERMAQNSDQVFNFLDRILKASMPAGLKEYTSLKQFANNSEGLADLKPWDVPYYSEKWREQEFQFNEEDLRPYFKLENVVDGVFEHAKKLYGLIFKENKSIPVYHPEVKAYEIFDGISQEYMGIFYTDFFPRATKKGGAWMTNYRSQGLATVNDQKKILRPHVSIVCNFTKPTESQPSLLTYDEVRTLFHEFGHALHSILSNCTYSSLGGVNVYWDFVELPSQIMENWTAEKESLEIFAHHYQTGDPMPKDLIDKIKKSSQFMAGSASCRQIQFGILDMAWHTTDPEHIQDLEKFEDNTIDAIRLLPKVPETMISTSFSHIFAGGYSAGYYSYKWAEVLDADAFEYFLEKGLFSKEVAQKFKDCILSRGSTEHPMELYKKFRGREPDPMALLRRDGLI